MTQSLVKRYLNCDKITTIGRIMQVMKSLFEFLLIFI